MDGPGLKSVANPEPRIEIGEICTEIWPPGYRFRVRSQVLKMQKKNIREKTFQKIPSKKPAEQFKSAKTT